MDSGLLTKVLFIQHDNIWPLLDHMLSFYMDMQKVWQTRCDPNDPNWVKV